MDVLETLGDGGVHDLGLLDAFIDGEALVAGVVFGVLYILLHSFCCFYLSDKDRGKVCAGGSFFRYLWGVYLL